MENWEKINSVQRMQDYIKLHLTESITLYQLARCAGYSPWHSAKIFKEYVGKSPFEYVRLLRLSQAALELRDNNKKVIDVAMDFVFDTHEGFTRAFRKQFGITPQKYKNDTPPIYLFTAYPIRDHYIANQEFKKMEENSVSNNFFVQVRNFPERKLIFKRAKTATEYYQYVEETGCDVWGLLCSIKEALYEPTGMWLPENLRPEGTSSYVQGVEVPTDYCGIVPDGFEIITLPACQMMMFQGEPFNDEDYEMAIGNISEVIDKYDTTLYGYEWADNDAPRFQMEPQGYRGYIEARPVRELLHD
ncbi:helix-turn-helix transcriptional regulator [Clostridium sp. DJ247]|uniref:helix-turn-helix transcriptional regulator n=1 Tax=Clostridium sp. DJ247 TaxID=2726188 RepID=UPI001629F5A5|nr:AraC family transcriptional regulator [Clostridium sp. DJ247]MBC2581309.1 helix-turn-helix transcriptional regulator [Clostridium sp. DJ247]